MTDTEDAVLGVSGAEDAVGAVCEWATIESMANAATAHPSRRCKKMGRVCFNKLTGMDTSGLLLTSLACAQILCKTRVGVSGCGQIARQQLCIDFSSFFGIDAILRHVDQYQTGNQGYQR